MGQRLNISEIRKHLDRSTDQLDAATLHKLQLARSNALQHQRSRKTIPILAWFGQLSSTHHDTTHSSRHFNWGIVALCVILLLGGVMYWQENDHDHSDVDIAILTDDLPVDMFVD